MWTAKDIVLRPIDSTSARALVRRIHYSGKVANNSQLHIGVFLGDKLEGAIQFGPSIDKRKVQGLVSGTQWHEFVELNRLAFSEALPRNSESRALGIAMKMLRKHAPQLKWVISFADGTQCGDGTIYRAAGFVLTGIKKNSTLWGLNGEDANEVTATKRRHVIANISVHSQAHKQADGAASMKAYQDAGYKLLEGFQLRYVYFLDPSARARLTVPEIPYSEIERRGARMYKGERLSRVVSADSGTATPVAGGGAVPTTTL